MQGKRGFLICIEGIDGCGKTTHAHLLVENLRKNGYEAFYTTEPTLGKIGNFIRRYLLERQKRSPSIIEALLFAADRVEHAEKIIKPALKQGKIVVSDRYVYSSLAYQGAAGLDLNWIWTLNKWIVQPDLALLIDIPPEEALQRIKRKKSVMETLENQKKVREIYLKFVEDGKLVKVDGDRSINKVATEILNVVLSRLKKD
jgi:dTMP kinase